MKRLLLLMATLPAFGHVVSMSTGEARINGSRVDYELRIPTYEVAHVKNPESTLLDAVQFRSGSDAPRVVQRSCREEAGTFICRAEYDFPSAVERLDVRCTLPAVVVPNHVHMLRASLGERSDQAAFDASFKDAELRFRPPSMLELAIRDIGSGFWRAAAGPAQVLFLLALVLAARSRREMLQLAAMFAAGQLLACAAAPAFGIWLAPRFLEAAAALTIAYLAVETLALPTAGSRWAVAGVLGLIHGLYFAMMLAAGNWSPLRFLAGVLLGEAVVLALLWCAVRLLGRAIPPTRFRWQTAFACALLGVGLGWFFLRLRS